ncbi:hypothetical protein ACFOOK_10865 [Micromonospora krabiensis]|uniref:Uncharacterized protein n=1 Tax=Micromonospora krabiensis TaxID=307121 RepID=A0A1C3NAC1_9ACTN|nr:hypothetical protein [Micromonospora krabiensis]SBV29509.1 hypothetical protein GA0070620_5082 [Micromonospora krabiensis]
MIPTLLLFGLLTGRWWRLSLVLAALLWPALLLADGSMTVGPALLGAAALAVANTAVGVLVHRGVRWALRRPRRPTSTAPPA